MKPFTIIVPVYNEEEVIAGNVQKLIDYSNTLSTPYEIIAVSNGSTDASVKTGQELQQKHPQFKFIALPEKGVGRAFKHGILEARYDHIIFMDADLSADLVFIKKSNELLDKHVLVLGTKIKGLQNRSLFRKMGSFIFYLSVLSLMGLKYVDYAPGAKAYRKGFLLKYFDYIDDHTSFVLNLTFIAAVKHEPIVEVTIACDDRRKSRFNLWIEAGSKYRGLFSLKLRQIFGKL
jgi:glycosyltransferase involved in cell wall biosynthesis